MPGGITSTIPRKYGYGKGMNKTMQKMTKIGKMGAFFLVQHLEVKV
jgi:hypothetical protein